MNRHDRPTVWFVCWCGERFLDLWDFEDHAWVCRAERLRLAAGVRPQQGKLSTAAARLRPKGRLAGSPGHYLSRMLGLLPPAGEQSRTQGG